jgi:sugar phosphate isomerase/epimerase
MQAPLTDFARLGLTHNSLFPTKHDPRMHLETLLRIVDRQDIEVVDLTIPYGREYRPKAIEIVRASGKTTVYNGSLMPTPLIPLGTLSPTERAQLLLLARDQVDAACEIGSVYFMQSVGSDPGDAARQRAFDGLAEYITDLDAYMKTKSRMAFLIELMDRDVHKKSLCGSTAEVVDFVRRTRERVPDLGVVLDINHLILMGEPFREAFLRCRKYLKHLHLGNCILKDRGHPLWGGNHPPIGIEGGQIDVPQLTELFRLLLDIGYLNRARRGMMSLEIVPFPGWTAEETIDDNLKRLEEAWRAV